VRVQERKEAVRKLWLQRNVEKRDGNSVLVFCGELQQKQPELLTWEHGDAFQTLKSDLTGLWRDD
jgi:hypothetical protein